MSSLHQPAVLPHSTRAYGRVKYAPDFRAVVDRIDEAVRKSLPTAQKEDYDKICVLSMTWSNDGMGIEPLAHELLQVFEDIYGYSVTHYRIQAKPPSGNVAFEFNKKISTFIFNNAAKRTLLIFVYSGHAVAFQSGFDTNWMGEDPANNPSTPQIKWNILRDLANNADGDHLYILDCCNASSSAFASALCNYSIKPEGNEFFVACGIECTASNDVAQSFTRRFIDLLKRFKDTPMSVTGLHNIMWSEAGEHETYLLNIPHKFGSGASGNSIVIRPLTRIPYHLQSIKQHDAASLGKVLITVSLQGRTTLPNAAAFQRWLLSFLPPGVSSTIRVQAVFDAESTTVLLATVPFSAWDVLQDDDLINFVAVVTSDNLLLSETAAQQARGLAVRPKSGKNEDLPFAGSSKQPPIR